MSVPTGGGFYQTAPQVDFSWLSKAWGYYKESAGTWGLAVLLGSFLVTMAYLVVAIPTGIFALYVDIIKMEISTFHGATPTPPSSMYDNPFLFEGKFMLFGFFAYGIMMVLQGGYYRMALKQIRGQSIAPTDILSIGEVALPLFALGIVSYVLIMISACFCILPEFVAMGLLMFAPLVLVDKGVGPITAITESFNLLKSQWLMATVFYFVMALMAGLGFYLCVVGTFVTYPLFMLSIAVGYAAFTNIERPLPGYGQPQAGVWPPPPDMRGGGGSAPPSDMPPPPV